MMKFMKWWDKSWNPITGCSPISEGCRNCWAAKMATRFPGLHGGPIDVFGMNPELRKFKDIKIHPDRLSYPTTFKKPKRIFTCALGDMFHDDSPAEFIFEIFMIIRDNPDHIFMILTKRPENILKKLPEGWGDPCIGILPNLWLGVTAENQRRADERIPILLSIPAAKRFVSIEPMLGPIEISAALNGYPKQISGREFVSHDMAIDAGMPELEGSLYSEEKWEQTAPALDWVICGKENGSPAAKTSPIAKYFCQNQGVQNCHECPDFACGDNITPGIRPMDLDWARNLRDQCGRANVPFFFKNGELDGKIWDQYPA